MGQLVGTAITGWIGFGGYLYGKSANVALDTSVDGCSASLNLTTFASSITLSGETFKPETTSPASEER